MSLEYFDYNFDWHLLEPYNLAKVCILDKTKKSESIKIPARYTEKNYLMVAWNSPLPIGLKVAIHV